MAALPLVFSDQLERSCAPGLWHLTPMNQENYAFLH
jgi:hypothetical protein